MAARFTRRGALLTQQLAPVTRSFSNFRSIRNVPRTYSYVFLVCGGVAAFTCANLLKTHRVAAAEAPLFKRDEAKAVKLTTRERRFIKFSSVEFDGQLYMTSQDFLDSVVESEARPRLARRILSLSEVNEMRDKTPALKKGSTHLFRDLRDKEPLSGFGIAFNMFDTDGNRRVDLKEFLVIQQILGGSFREHDLDEATRRVLLHLVSTIEQARQLKIKQPKKREVHNEFIERLLGLVSKLKKNVNKNDKTAAEKNSAKEEEPKQEPPADDDVGLHRQYMGVTTTFLQSHFFGPKGDKVLNYQGFHKFMENLQTEVLDIEFNEFSKGHMMITEVDFARILLRYTYLEMDEYDAFLERLLNRIKEQTGITFDEFRDFCRFLNNLEDFSIAMRIYTMANHPISKSEFSRTIKICTGYSFSQHLIDTVFAIFDADGDGRLSYKEFIAIMLDRLHRGFRPVSKTEGWEGFKYCIKTELMTL